MESSNPPTPPPAGASSTPEKAPIAHELDGAAAGADGPPASPPPEHRIEDLHARVTRIDRDLRIRIDAVLAATIFSLLAAIAAIVLVISANDENATKDQVRGLRNDVESVGQTAAAAKKDVKSATTRLDTVEGTLSTLSDSQTTNQDELSAAQSDIKTLRERIAKLEDAVARESAAKQKSAASPSASP